jgi:hypothetical protein
MPIKKGHISATLIIGLLHSCCTSAEQEQSKHSEILFHLYYTILFS